MLAYSRTSKLRRAAFLPRNSGILIMIKELLLPSQQAPASHANHVRLSFMPTRIPIITPTITIITAAMAITMTAIIAALTTTTTTTATTTTATTTAITSSS